MAAFDDGVKHLYIVGHPVDHSKSPVMYNAVYSQLGLPWEYGFMDIDSDDKALEFLRGDGYISVNVTTPCKPQAYEASDIKAATAQLAGGVNLIVQKEGTHLGYNVDGDGCVRFLEREGVAFAGRKVVVCGTGPTSLSILNACVQAGADEVLLIGRDKDRAKSVLDGYIDRYSHLLATAITFPAVEDGRLGFEEAYENVEFKFGSYTTSTKAIAAADIIMDASVLGMKEGDPAPFDTSLLSERQIVLDTVYGHGETALVKAARERGCRTYDGAGMLVSQAVLSATIVCEIMDVELDMDYSQLFDIMSDAAGFEF